MKLQSRKLGESHDADILFLEFEAGYHESGVKLCDIALGFIGTTDNSRHIELAKKVWNWAKMNRRDMTSSIIPQWPEASHKPSL